ncbi:hypothetical protein HMPREF9445_03007 [Bacteroides clarus YIT 12056]|uniref:Uncharacterized protein n=1 Tax=Bacteroides clarus YIT 12056 TaxID=762984 RepID=A0ABN0CK09_9BACE|nr:hypothetical protein HMPREF9445_03007 [Bacteroides clarus YIT 12056]
MVFGQRKIKKGGCSAIAFFYFFFSVLIRNSLVDKNVRNQSYYN